jgi:hypothetical protein
MFARRKRSGRHIYLQLAESYRDGARVRQRLVASLGRLDLLERNGGLENLARSLTRFSDRLAVLQSKEPAPEWADIVRDLESLKEAEVKVDGKRFRVRSEMRGAAVQAFRACGVALPPLGRPL